MGDDDFLCSTIYGRGLLTGKDWLPTGFRLPNAGALRSRRGGGSEMTTGGRRVLQPILCSYKVSPHLTLVYIFQD